MRGWMVAALPLLVLAGCSEGSPTTVEESPTVITDPRDLLNGTAPGSHIHDYWNGRDRIAILDDDGSVWSQCSGGCSNGMQGATARPAEGIIVPQGTRWINGTFTFQPHAENRVSTYELWVKTAADGEERFVAALQPGEPFSIESSRGMNDPPHYVLSLWRFAVVAKTGGDVTFRGDYEWQVEAVRGLPLEPYPPHPDHWGGATRLDLMEDTAGAVVMYEAGGGRTCYASATRCPGVHGMPNGTVVPYDAARVEVRLAGNVVGLGLWYHGADTWDLKPVQGRPDGAGLLFEVPLDGDGDSPYAAQSLWELYVGLDATAPAGAWTGAYTISAAAFR